ncbi:cysteine dioxygenase family protein [Streptomyces luteolus]|uniref:cysteine dioxygenase family protein n=1 Tax=Streptomyces luteolus TaxID=3043615 RepID=UPI0038D1A416
MTSTDQFRTGATTPRLRALVSAIREGVAEANSPARRALLAGRQLQRYICEPGLLTPHQCMGDRTGYRQHVLHVEPSGTFSLVALVWLPGQGTAVHDHVCWCVAGVHAGREVEQRYRLSSAPRGAQLLPVEHRVNAVGGVTAFAPPGDIHQVRNPGPGKAISLHVYGTDIDQQGSSIRRIYTGYEDAPGPSTPPAGPS